MVLSDGEKRKDPKYLVSTINLLTVILKTNRFIGYMASQELDKMPFEEALAALEKIVQDLENGQVPLADLVKKYTEGTRYLNVCQDHLKAAELVLEQIQNS